jgi:hypothetical protein
MSDVFCVHCVLLLGLLGKTAGTVPRKSTQECAERRATATGSWQLRHLVLLRRAQPAASRCWVLGAPADQKRAERRGKGNGENEDGLVACGSDTAKRASTYLAKWGRGGYWEKTRPCVWVQFSSNWAVWVSRAPSGRGERLRARSGCPSDGIATRSDVRKSFGSPQS